MFHPLDVLIKKWYKLGIYYYHFNIESLVELGILTKFRDWSVYNNKKVITNEEKCL